MLGYQLTHTLLNLIAHTWPGSDQLGSCTPGVPHAQSSRETGLGMIRSDKYQFVSNFNVDTVDTAKKHVFTQWNLRANWSNRLEIQGMSTLSTHACWKIPSRVLVGKDQRDNLVRLANYANELSGKWLENIKRNLPTKNWYARKASFLQDPGYVEYCRHMLHDACNEIRSHPNSFHCICWHCRYTYDQITM